jgi:hypothetical protein
MPCRMSSTSPVQIRRSRVRDSQYLVELTVLSLEEGACGKGEARERFRLCGRDDRSNLKRSFPRNLRQIASAAPRPSGAETMLIAFGALETELRPSNWQLAKILSFKGQRLNFQDSRP